MNSQFDSQSHLLRNTDEISINQLKICKFCSQSLTIIKQEDYEISECKTSISQQSDVQNNNFYYSLVLINEKVNVHHLKRFIEQNQIHLRQIIIQHCQFYLNDRDLLNQQNPVGSLRMLQEIDFNYMFEMFQFQDISIIELDMCKLDLLKGTTYTVSNEDRNIKNNVIKKHTTKIKSLQHNDIQMTKDEFTTEFDCKEDCNMIQYEFEVKNEFYQLMTEKKSLEEEKIMQKLKWGDFLDQDKFGEILLNNFLSEIKFHLETYKSYTKHSFNKGILLILGDVLKNQLSLNQLQNQIKINLQNITEIIFKGNESIPDKAFNQLMMYFLQIPNLQMIGFFGSVLNQLNLEDFLYLIQLKKIQYIILHKSYFLKNEINKIINLKEKDFILNHLKYYILDVQFNQVYEFTPFSFTIEDLKQKQTNDLLQVEQVYLKQQKYPKKISSQINYLSGKNLSILHNNKSTQLLLTITDMDNQRYSQNEIYNFMEQLILTDDIHYINYQIFMKQKNLLNENSMKKLEDQFFSMKSCKATIEVFTNFVQSDIQNYRFWQFTILSFLSGFTRIKSNDYSFIIQSKNNNPILGVHPSVKKNKQLKLQDIKQEFKMQYSEISAYSDKLDNQETVTITDEVKSKDEINNILQKSKKLQKMIFTGAENQEIFKQIQFDQACQTIQKLSFNCSDEQNQLFRNALQKCRNLKSLKCKQVTFNFENFNEADIFLKRLEILKFSDCTFKNNSFLNVVLLQATQLKKLSFDRCNYSQNRLNIENIPKYIEILKLPHTPIQQNYQDFYVFVLTNLHNLKEIDLYETNDIKDQINSEKFENHNAIFHSLEKINLNSLDSNVVKLLDWILKCSPKLKSFQLFIYEDKQKSSFNFDEDGFKKLDLKNIQNLEIQIFYSYQYLTILQQFKNINTLKLKSSMFSPQVIINTISKKISKLIVEQCIFDSIHFFQQILQECNNLRYLKMKQCQNKSNEKFNFSKLNIYELQKFKFIQCLRFTNLDFPQEILKRFQKTLKIIQFQTSTNWDALENSDFISILTEKNNLEELNNNNNYTYPELFYILEKTNCFFNISDFNLKNTWDKESIKNQEINFFKVFDSQNITIFQQMKKPSELSNFQNSIQIKSQKQNDSNKSKIVQKYYKYPPINFYNTFNISNNIYKKTDHIQSIQILELKFKCQYNICNQHLINLIQNQHNLTDIILIGIKNLENKQQLNFNDQYKGLTLRKIIIQYCKISTQLVSLLIQSQNLEELKINNFQDDKMRIESISTKLKKLDLSQNINIQINKNKILQECQDLEFICFESEMNYSINFNDFAQNLKVFISFKPLMGEQVNQISKRCQQLQIFQFTFDLQDEQIKTLNFDFMSKYLKKLVIFKVISFSENEPLTNYFFFNKIKSNSDYYYNDFINLLQSNTEENKNNMYLEIYPQLMNNLSFTKYIEQKKIIGLNLMSFNDKELSNFFHTYRLQLQNLKHLIIKNFYCQLQNDLIINNSLEYFIYENTNSSINLLESLQFIVNGSELVFDNKKKLNVNLFKTIKSLSLEFIKINQCLLKQILQDCISLENLSICQPYTSPSDFSEIVIPLQIKSIALENFDQNIVSSQNISKCDQLKVLALFSQRKHQIRFQEFAKKLRNFKNKTLNDD